MLPNRAKMKYIVLEELMFSLTNDIYNEMYIVLYV